MPSRLYFLLFFFSFSRIILRREISKRQKCFPDRALLLRSNRVFHAEKHVRREESDSRGWWFRTELGRIVAGSKLRLSPLSEGYKDPCVAPGKELRWWWRWRWWQAHSGGDVRDRIELISLASAKLLDSFTRSRLFLTKKIQLLHRYYYYLFLSTRNKIRLLLKNLKRIEAFYTLMGWLLEVSPSRIVNRMLSIICSHSYGITRNTRYLETPFPPF